MKTLKVEASGSYEIIIGKNLLDAAGEYISRAVKCKKAFIVSDDNVFSLYGERLVKSLEASGFLTENFVFPHGEQSKNLKTYGELLNKMCEVRISRGDIAVALGGGVVGDITGFAAATYLRGIKFVQIPTSLLAAVDSSVGGKTGVDLDKGKNQVGAFYQPSLVLCDTDVLATLPDIEYRNGCAEIIKYTMIAPEGGKEFFDLINKTPICDIYEDVIAKCVDIKRDFVEKDERDLGCRMMLNFGHTIGHAVETKSKYAVPHGQAVAIGMAIVSDACAAKGICDKATAEALKKLIVKYNLPITAEYKAEELIEAALTDKKINGDTLNLVVPVALGESRLEKINKNELLTYMKSGGLE